MPGGAEHAAIWRRGLAFVPWVAVPLAAVWPAVGLGFGLGYLLGRYVDPDLDQIGLTQAEGRMMRELGLLGGLFAWYWFLYGYIFRGKHRSIWTHLPGLSTAIRLVYLAPAPVYLIWRFNLYQAWMLWALLGLWLGLSLADSLHWWADMRPGKRRRKCR